MVDEDGNLDLDEGEEFKELNGGDEGWEVYLKNVKLIVQI